MPGQYIVVERDEPIAIATINRPDKLNALNWELIAELADELETLDADDAIHCIVLTGAGERAFAFEPVAQRLFEEWHDMIEEGPSSPK